MGSGIDKNLRLAFLQRLQATTRFWEMSKVDYMFIRKGFHASVSGTQFPRPDETEDWPEPTDPYYYVNSFKPHSLIVDKISQFAKKEISQIGVFPVNGYAWGSRIDGPYLPFHDNHSHTFDLNSLLTCINILPKIFLPLPSPPSAQ